MNGLRAFSVRYPEAWVGQFSGLRERHPGLWPRLPQLLLLLTFILAVVAAGAWLCWIGQWEELELGAAQEEKLRIAFREKVIQSKNLELLRAQKARVTQQVATLERQLPNRSEMDAMLHEINQAGIGRGLQFELFKPGQLQLGEHYAELPIDIRLSGDYHALAGFVSDLANLPRIVTMDHITITRQKERLSFQAIVHTYRYLDVAENQQLVDKPADAVTQKGRKP